MNIVLLDRSEVRPDGYASLDGRRAEHVAKVLGKAPGDALAVGLRGGKLGSATVVSSTKQALELKACVFARDPAPKRAITLVLALPRPPVFRRILQHVTALGIERIVLLHSRRVEKSYWMSPSLEPDAIDTQLQLGLEQAVDTVAPAVERARGFKAFVSERLPELACGARLLVAHPGPFPPCPADVPGRVVLLVGPEGGFIPYEIEHLTHAGAQGVSLGPRILRVETATLALLGRLGG
ncbi:MAG: 16S rRNA (uracil(1498)-N(3))-methyltransferase [Nannocystaceae bacterium]|nr:16S rRNA (uracil(1498)-N(3))-methyltransferase [Nannocystaceae bacterium]